MPGKLLRTACHDWRQKAAGSGKCGGMAAQGMVGAVEAWLPHESRTIKENAPLIRSNILSLYGSIDVSWPAKQGSQQATKAKQPTEVSPCASCESVSSSSNGSGAIQKVLAQLSQVAIYVSTSQTLSPSIRCFNKYIACVLPSAGKSF